jgi:multicomponent Na+:H+ antiporter subunit B
MTMIEFIDVVLLVLLAATAVAVVLTRNLLAAVILAGIFSLLSAGLFTVMDAVDVAFTEAAVGAGISTVLLIGTLALTTREEAKSSRRSPLPLLAVLATGAVLIYGTLDMPRFGDPEAPVHTHVAPEYLKDSVPHAGGSAARVDVENIVTSVLASYRGYDTLGETTVIFAAGVGVLLLLKGTRPGRGPEDGR